jgi:two-component system cell cycle sensor histidine kinase/response regulator CckA
MELVKQRVLLVDDEPQILLALEDLLCEEYTVLTSSTPKHALELVRLDPELAVVVTDQRMPDMTGDEFLSQIDAQSHVERIMVSGFADLPAVLRAFNDGKVFAYVTKPWDEADLRHKVHAAADHFRLTEQLEHERRLLRDLLDNSPDGIYFKDAQLRFLRANAAFARSLGKRTPEELEGRRLSDLLGDDSEAVLIEAEERGVLRELRPILDAIRCHPSSGKSRFTSETKAPICGSTGSAIGLVAISRDVTERIETNEALRASEALLQQQTRILNSVLDGMGDGVVAVAVDGRTLIFNQEASRILGVDARDVAADGWPAAYGLYLSDARTPLPVDENPLSRAMTGESLVHMPLCVRNATVAGRWVDATATPLRDAAGAVAGAILLLRDVTQQRSLEGQLTQARRLEAIGRLAGGVGHDFNNLLTVIVACGELALEDLSQGDPQRGNLDEILAAAHHATLLIRQLLAFSQQQVVEPKELQLNDVVAGMEKILSRLTGDKTEIFIVLRPGLTLITADQGQVEQVVVNLVVNARDAMPDGGRLTIETDEEEIGEGAAAELGGRPGQFVTLTVTDTGTGMTEETRQRLFEPFFTAKEPDKGTGLGLSTVYGVMCQNGGDIRVTSALGEGTKFRVLWPKTIRSA